MNRGAIERAPEEFLPLDQPVAVIEVENAEAMRQYLEAKGVKVPAAWLVEHAGFSKGYTENGVGISTKHALALVNRGGLRMLEHRRPAP